MKNLFVSLLTLLVLAAGCVILGQPAAESRGEVFEGTGAGFRGHISVLVRMIGSDITEIEIIESQEDRFIGAQAMEELLELVIMYNSTDLDAVSGATNSSRGFLEAVEDAIMKK